jgi:hypothetical protein
MPGAERKATGHQRPFPDEQQEVIDALRNH